MNDFRLNDAVVRPRLNEIQIDGRSEKLPAKFIDVLMVLAEHQGEVLHKDELLKRVWNDPLIGEDSLANAVWMLRKTLGDDAKRPAYIETVPRRGYRLIAEVAPVADPPDVEPAQERVGTAPTTAERAALAEPPAAARRGRLLIVATLAAVVVVALVVAMKLAPPDGARREGPAADAFAFRTSGDITELTLPVAGTMLIAEHGGPFYGIDSTHGTERWRLGNGEAVLLAQTAYDGRVYLGSEDGFVYALELATGRELWRHAAGAAVQSVPVVRDGVLVYGDVKGNVRALAAADAKPLWQGKLGDRVSGIVLAPLDLAIVRAHDGTIGAFERATGKIRWQRRIEGRLTDLVELSSTALVFASDAGFVMALDTATGATRWRAAIAAVEMQPLVAGDRVFALGRLGDFVALAPDDGHLLWQTRLDVADIFDLVWWRDRVVVVLDGGALGVIDPATGRLERSLMLGEIPDGVEADGARLIVATQSGRVLALSRAGLAGQPLGRLQLDADAHWTRPIDGSGARYAIEPLREGVRLPELAFRVAVDGDVQDVAVGADGTIFFGDERSAAALTPHGDVLWRVALDRAQGTEFALGDDTVYFGRARSVQALDRASGKTRWTAATDEMVVAPPTLDGARLLVGCDDHKLHVFDAANGTPLWSFATQRVIRSTPSVASGMAIFGSADQHVYAIDLESGAPRWKFSAPGWVAADPVVRGARVFVGAGSGDFFALALDSGKELWRVHTGSAISYRPAADEATVYFGSADGYVYAVDQESGTERWRYRTGAGADGSIALGNGVVYAGSRDSHLYAIEAATGQPLWRLKTGGSVLNPKLGRGVLYVASADQHLYALRL